MSEISQKQMDVFTSKSRADKAINSLKGILLGIISNETVNKTELEELKKWAKKYALYIY